MSNLVEVYTKLLVNLGCEVDEDGMVTIQGKNLMVDTHLPNTKTGNEKGAAATIVERRPVALPTDARLEGKDQRSFTYFHPLGESLFRGNSEILNLIIMLARVRVKVELVAIMKLLLRMAQDTGKHGKLNQALIDDYITPIGAVSSSSAKAIEGLIDKLAVSKDGSIFQSLMALNVQRVSDGRPSAYWKVNFDPEDPPEICKLTTKTASANWAALVNFIPKDKTVSSSMATAPAFFSLVELLNYVFSSLTRIAKDVKRYEEYDVGYQEITADDMEVLVRAYEKRYNQQMVGNIGIGGSDPDVEEKSDNPVSERPTRRKDDAMLDELTRPAERPLPYDREPVDDRPVSQDVSNPLADALNGQHRRPVDRHDERIDRRRDSFDEPYTEYRDPRDRERRDERESDRYRDDRRRDRRSVDRYRDDRRSDRYRDDRCDDRYRDDRRSDRYGEYRDPNFRDPRRSGRR